MLIAISTPQSEHLIVGSMLAYIGLAMIPVMGGGGDLSGGGCISSLFNTSGAPLAHVVAAGSAATDGCLRGVCTLGGKSDEVVEGQTAPTCGHGLFLGDQASWRHQHNCDQPGSWPAKASHPASPNPSDEPRRRMRALALKRRTFNLPPVAGASRGSPIWHQWPVRRRLAPPAGLHFV